MCIVLICTKNKAISETLCVVYPQSDKGVKRQYPDGKVTTVEILPDATVEDQISTPSDLFDFSYSELKLSECLYTTSRVGKNEWVLVCKIVGCHCRPNLSSLFFDL